jgi:DNA invertase Pin-like site-specific DNA recombinase
MSACRPLPDSVPTVVDVLVETLADLLTSKGMPHAAAQVAAKRQVDQILHKLGGGWFYLPRRVDFTRQAQKARNALVLDMLRQGIPFHTILGTLHVSRATLYRIQSKKP